MQQVGLVDPGELTLDMAGLNKVRNRNFERMKEERRGFFYDKNAFLKETQPRMSSKALFGNSVSLPKKKCNGGYYICKYPPIFTPVTMGDYSLR